MRATRRPGRDERRAIAEETDAIVAAGGYEPRDGGRVDLSALLAPALAGSHLHLPDEVLPPAVGGGRLAVEVTNETTLAAARRIVRELGRASPSPPSTSPRPRSPAAATGTAPRRRRRAWPGPAPSAPASNGSPRSTSTTSGTVIRSTPTG